MIEWRNHLCCEEIRAVCHELPKCCDSCHEDQYVHGLLETYYSIDHEEIMVEVCCTVDIFLAHELLPEECEEFLRKALDKKRKSYDQI